MRYLDLTISQAVDLCTSHIRTGSCFQCEMNNHNPYPPICWFVGRRPHYWRETEELQKDCTHLGYPLLQAGPRYMDLSLELFSEAVVLEDRFSNPNTTSLVLYASVEESYLLEPFGSELPLTQLPCKEFQYLHPEIYGPVELPDLF